MIYKVWYQSMTADYGPAFIEAGSEEEARARFGGGAFSRGERGLIRAEPVSPADLRRALEQDQEED